MSPTIARPEHSHFRWTVCALLFFATTISYVDRQVLSILANTLAVHIGWTDMEYGRITAAFSMAYAIGLLGAGRLLDRFGTRIGFAIAVGLWSLAAMTHAVATTAFTFGIARVLLGFGEAVNFPACIKTVAEWFPRRQRGTATGIFNSGANVGAIVTLLCVPTLAEKLGWQSAFIFTGSIGIVWVVAWLVLYRRPEVHPKVSAEELAMIQADPETQVESVPWIRVLPRRETWAFALGKFFSDPVWTFFLFWLPKYLQDTYHLTLMQLPVPTLIVYNASTIGSIYGGWLSGSFINRGWTVNAARKTAMLICAVCVLPVLYVPFASNMWVVVGVLSLALAAHQGWSANLFTATSDMFPKVAVASVVGIGGALGQLGNVLILYFAGWIVTVRGQKGGYFIVFMVCGCAYLVALGIIHLFSPRLEQAKLD